LARISSAVLVHRKGSHRWFQASMKTSMALVSSLTLVKVPRRMAWRVMMPKKISTRFIWTVPGFMDTGLGGEFVNASIA
jgi:hypothetical protein